MKPVENFFLLIVAWLMGETKGTELIGGMRSPDMNSRLLMNSKGMVSLCCLILVISLVRIKQPRGFRVPLE